MALPILHGVGRCTADPEMRFTPAGTAVCTISLAFNSRRKNAAGEWEDGDVLFIRGTLFRQEAENAAETYARGMEVIVTGRVKLDQWQDKETGQKRSAPSLLIDSIGPSTKYATAAVRKVDRQGAAENGSADPWGSAPPAAGGNYSDEPPF
ncbi:single-stranded DNA-binding protein [Saccharopolyspora shandongensis]|uniref:single-stranded DNA-binding protein n=1 Tax=Saccharopolyspora shandongensis TaxID=418495 RepID=UPI00341A4487